MKKFIALFALVLPFVLGACVAVDPTTGMPYERELLRQTIFPIVMFYLMGAIGGIVMMWYVLFSDGRISTYPTIYLTANERRGGLIAGLALIVPFILVFFFHGTFFPILAKIITDTSESVGGDFIGGVLGFLAGFLFLPGMVAAFLVLVYLAVRSLTLWRTRTVRRSQNGSP